MTIELRISRKNWIAAVYSLASPRRQHPVTGELHTSTLKPIGGDVVQKGVNTDKEEIQDFPIEAATQEEIDNTVAMTATDASTMLTASSLPPSPTSSTMISTLSCLKAQSAARVANSK